MSWVPPLVCPACRGPLSRTPAAYECGRCAIVYPIVCGIPDFRLEPDPYIELAADRRKAEHLFAQGAARSFEDLVRYYYSITPEDPADLAERWTAHAVAEVAIARGLLSACAWSPAAGVKLLDVGCNTGAMLIAAAATHAESAGVDVALRWLAVGLIRLRERGVDATLVCANAEHLPFAEGTFGAVTAIDTLEHVRDVRAALREARRVSRPGAMLLCTANNRLSPLPEPNVHVWGVGYLPTRCQAWYVRRRRADLHPYKIHLMMPAELRASAVAAGYEAATVVAAPMVAPHAARWVQRFVRVYEAARRRPVMRSLLRVFGPRLLLRAAATASTPSAPSPAGEAGT